MEEFFRSLVGLGGHVMRVGIDTGGTFTDLVAIDQDGDEILVAKRPSTPRVPHEGVFDALEASGIGPEGISYLVLGTTIAINALHQRSGARVLYLTTKGFEDVPFIQRINRRHHYDLSWIKPAPFAQRRDCIGVNERISKDGSVLVPLADAELTRIASVVRSRVAETQGPIAIAVNLLFSYAHHEHEQRLGQFLQDEFPDLPVSLSHRVAPVWREYERGTTTLADAYVKHLVSGFAEDVDVGLRERGLDVPVHLMKSNGGQMVAASAREYPVQLLLSGLAGGVIAGRYFGDLVGSRSVVTLDMGGTSTDVGLVVNGEYGFTTEYQVEWGLPVATPFIDVTTIGAGGGSIAWIDRGGFLKVGPQSAGAEPGPACYDAGGMNATVTDANLVLGWLNPDHFLGGRMKLNRDRAVQALGRVAERLGSEVEEVALSIVRLANENMADAIRLVTVERGIDPRDLDLVAMGGAGPLHAVALADAVGIGRVIIPPNAGLASAFGTLVADLRVDRSWTHAYRSNALDVDRIDERFESLTMSALEDLASEGFDGEPLVQRSISMRYMGQNYEQDVSVPPGRITKAAIHDVFDRFHRQHQGFYGYEMPGEVIELIHFNVSVIGAVPKVRLPLWRGAPGKGATPALRPVHLGQEGARDCPVYFRHELAPGSVIQGPAVVDDADSTVALPAERRLTVTDRGIVIID